ncbi:MAG: DUF2934 domain-containing protein, partial [Syntrophaceae bacterium]
MPGPSRSLNPPPLLRDAGRALCGHSGDRPPAKTSGFSPLEIRDRRIVRPQRRGYDDPSATECTRSPESHPLALHPVRHHLRAPGKLVSRVRLRDQEGLMNQETHAEIERVAFELYERSGHEEGKDLINWLAAEKIVLGRLALSG